MRFFPAVCVLLASTGVSGVVLQLRGFEPVRVSLPQFVPVRIAVDQRAVPPAPARRVGCARAPSEIGTPLATLPAAEPAGDRYWRVLAAADQCVIAAWSGATIVASWDDGATFLPVLEQGSPIVGAALRDDGTLFVMREDFTLGVAYPDGSSISRSLAFRGDLLARGAWLVVRTDGGPAISNDDGASWRQLDWGDGYVVDLHVLDDGAIVALSDRASVLCDHFGCGGPTTEYLESHLDGRPWKPASGHHVRAASRLRTAAAVPPGRAREFFLDSRVVLDSHRMLVEVAANRHVVRYTKTAGWRLLFTGPS
jgi:hypothetical protein